MNQDINILDEQKRLDKIEAAFRRYDFPPSIILETTSHCNLNCIQCSNSEMTRPRGYISTALFKKVIDEIALENPDIDFWICGFGEPLLSRYNLYYIIDYAKKKGLKNILLNTNGTLIDDDMAEMLIDSGIDKITIGVDGFSKETYDKIRVNGKRDVVYSNILNLLEKIQNNGLNKPEVELQFIVMDQNEQELSQWYDFWEPYPVKLKVRHKNSWANSIEIDPFPNLKRVACGWGIGTFPITWDGNVTNCGCDMDARHTYGNVKDRSIKEIWNGDRQKFVDVQFDHDWDKLPELCKNCEDWRVVGATFYDSTGRRYDKEYK